MGSTRSLARLAGLLYLLVSIPGFYGLIYVPSKLIVHGDAAATSRSLLASEAFFRSGIVADLVGQALFIPVALVLYRLLKGSGAMAAALMVILLVVQIPLAFVAEAHHLDALRILDAAGPGRALGEAQRDALAMLALGSYSSVMQVSEIFMGLWLFPLGWLVYRAGFLPRWLGLSLFVAGGAYLADSLAYLLSPSHAQAIGAIASRLRAIELVTPLWLLIMGAKDQPITP